MAHETEIPRFGDFVTRMLGRMPVVVVCNADGVARAFLNSCRHRGTKLCRADAGNVRNFVCPYHGWAYDRDGKLLTTSYDHLQPEGMDLSQWSFEAVPRIASYDGLTF